MWIHRIATVSSTTTQTLNPMSRQIRLFLGCLVCITAPLAHGAPFTYSFDMPPFGFEIGNLGGQISILDITVDNGNTSTANQAYLNTEILGLTVTSGASFVEFTSPPDALQTVGEVVYLTTDAAGIATLSLLDTPVSTLAQYYRGPLNEPENESIQLGTLVTGQGGSIPYTVEFADGGFGGILQGFEVTGNTPPKDDFVTTWQTDNPGTSNDTSITVPMVGGAYDVDWDNDGVFDEFGLANSSTHDYEVIGTYTIRIHGTFDSIQFGNGGDKEKILSIDQWGTNSWTSMQFAFSGATNLQVPATDTPDFSAVTNMLLMFSGATSANPDTSGWDTSAVTSMSGMFQDASSANPDTSGWDTALVNDMSFMFNNTPSANPDTNGWDTAAVTNMVGMFRRAASANPDISGWDTSAVRDMDYMFWGATSFDQDIGSWDVTSLVSATEMFTGVTLSTPNYDSLLTGWNAQALQPGVIFSGGNSKYCSAAAITARDNMITSDSWIITDGGLCSPDDVYITSFMVSPNTVLIGEITQVSWQVTNAESCTAQGGPPEWLGANITLPAGSLDLAVGEQGCYTLGLECLNGLNTVSETINLEVKHPDVIFMDNFEQPCLLP